jgi:hypothetical protein
MTLGTVNGTSRHVYEGRVADADLARTTADFAFLAVFPGFFFYHSAAGLGLIELVLGGYRSIVAAAFALPLLFFYVRLLPTLKAKWIDAAFFGFVGYLLLVVGLNFVLGADADVLRGHFFSAIQWTSVFLMFRLGGFRSRWFVRAAWASLFGMSAITFAFAQDGFFYLTQLGLNDSESLASYQQLALSYTMVFFVLLMATKQLLIRSALFILCIATLWLHGARSEFAAVFLVLAAMEFVHSRRRGSIAMATAVLAMALYAGLDVIIAALPDNRMVQLFDLSENTSWQSRNELLDQALSTIASNPLLGDYGSYVKAARFSGAGDYAHNILSAWVDLGLPGFVYLSLLLAVPLFRLGSFAFGQHRDPLFLMALSLTLFSGMLLVVAKEFTYLPIAAALGAYASFEGSLRALKRKRQLLARSEHR